jgi:hypothetical protein
VQKAIEQFVLEANDDGEAAPILTSPAEQPIHLARIAVRR